MHIKQSSLIKPFQNQIAFENTCPLCNINNSNNTINIFSFHIKEILSLSNINNKDLLYLSKIAFINKNIKCIKCVKEMKIKIKIMNNDLQYVIMNYIWDDMNNNDNVNKINIMLQQMKRDSFYSEINLILKGIVFYSDNYNHYISLLDDSEKCFVLYLGNIFLCFNNYTDGIIYIENLQRNYYPIFTIYELENQLKKPIKIIHPKK